jgi:hypothetical protein
MNFFLHFFLLSFTHAAAAAAADNSSRVISGTCGKSENNNTAEN